jgi:hypothetical protein
MRNNRGRGDLYARLEALEDRLISPLDRRIEQLSVADRKQYDKWRAQCREHFRQYDGEPGTYFKNWLDGTLSRPELPRHVNRQLSNDALEILVTDDLDRARDKWQRTAEGQAR